MNIHVFTYRFHELFRGNAVTFRVTRLQPDTKYTLRVAAASSSGQGEWSIPVTFTTSPAPPPAPGGLELTQVSSDTLQMTWTKVVFPHPVAYEVQYRVASGNLDYQQVCILHRHTHCISL